MSPIVEENSRNMAALLGVSFRLYVNLGFLIMTKLSSDKDQLNHTKAVMGKLAAMPHKPHAKKKGKAKKEAKTNK